MKSNLQKQFLASYDQWHLDGHNRSLDDAIRTAQTDRSTKSDHPD